MTLSEVGFNNLNLILQILKTVYIAADQDSVAIGVMTRDVATLGKNNQVLHVNVPPDLVNVIKYVISLHELVGVPSSNPYVFAVIGSADRYRSSHAYLVKAAKESGAKKPHLLSSQGQRRFMCTEANVRLF